MSSNTDKSGLELIGILVLGIVFGILISAFRAVIAISVATWFHFPLSFSFAQWFGIIELFNLMRVRYDGTKKSSETPYLDIFISATILLGVWGILWIAHIIIT